MSWVNLATITTARNWQFTEPVTGNLIRLRHLTSVAVDDLPWGFIGLIAQAFNYPTNIELLDIKKVYPYNYRDVYLMVDPWEGVRSRRIAIRGQRRFSTPITWTVGIDVWHDHDDVLTPPSSSNQSFATQQAFFFLQ